jgi:hypothetical protein
MPPGSWCSTDFGSSSHSSQWWCCPAPKDRALVLDCMLDDTSQDGTTFQMPAKLIAVAAPAAAPERVEQRPHKLPPSLIPFVLGMVVAGLIAAVVLAAAR